jgi:hypothetical protein
MVMRKFVGMPLQQTKSVWHWAVRFFANIGRVGQELMKKPKFRSLGEKLMNLPNVKSSLKVSGIEIIAPNSLVLQPFMKGEFLRLPSRSPEQRVQSSFMTDRYREADPALTREIERTIPLYQFDSHKREIMLDYGAAMRDLEFGMVMRGSLGLKTHGFSPERMAELAVDRVKPKITARFASMQCESIFGK